MKSSKEISILSISTDLFEKNNFMSIGIDRLISESNVAKTTFYRYFPSKEILIEKVLERKRLYLIYSLEEVMKEKIEPLEKLQELFLWFSSWFTSHEFHGCIFMKAQEEFPNNLNLRKINISYKQWLEDEVENIFNKTGLRDSRKLASLFVIILDGLTVKANLGTITYEDIHNSWKFIISLSNQYLKEDT